MARRAEIISTIEVNASESIPCSIHVRRQNTDAVMISNGIAPIAECFLPKRSVVAWINEGANELTCLVVSGSSLLKSPMDTVPLNAVDLDGFDQQQWLIIGWCCPRQ